MIKECDKIAAVEKVGLAVPASFCVVLETALCRLPGQMGMLKNVIGKLAAAWANLKHIGIRAYLERGDRSSSRDDSGTPPAR